MAAGEQLVEPAEDEVQAARRASGSMSYGLRRSLLIWGAMVAALACSATLLPAANGTRYAKVLLATGGILGGCIGFAALVSYFAVFVLSRQFKFLLLAAAFAALSGGGALQVAADFSGDTPTVRDWIATVTWLVAAILLAGAAHSTTTWTQRSRFFDSVRLALSSVFVLAFPLAVLPYTLNAGVFDVLNGSPLRSFAAYIADTVAAVLTLALLGIALVGNYRNGTRTQDRLSAVLCYFLAPCWIGIVCRAASGARFDSYWLAGHLLLSGAWLVWAARFAVEGAISHTESAERLTELEALHQISWSLVGAGGTGQLLGVFCRTLGESVEAEVTAVYLSNESGDSLQLAAATGREDYPLPMGATYAVAPTDRRPGFHTGHTARAFTTKQTQTADGVFIDVELVPWRLLAEGNGCAVSLPLVDQQNAIGVLDVYFRERGQLTESRLRFLNTIATAATPAIENARALELAARPNDLESLDRAA